MKILFVDHACHLKTKSTGFIVDILRRQHDVDEHYYERCYHCNLPKDKVAWADVIVFLEFLPYRFACGVPGKKCVFIPMYDNEWGSKWLWRRLAMLGMNVVSFCRAVGNHARRYGVQNVLDVQYAKDPAKYVGLAGNSRVGVFWDRHSIAPENVRKLFPKGTLDKLIVYDKFLPREEFDAMTREVGVYVAPRFSEGIGMSFLEPLAMGKCVIAHDAPTMNEYIVNGKNGILVDMRNPRQITAEEIEKAKQGVAASAQALYNQWVADQDRMLEFFNKLETAAPLRSPWSLKSMVTYLFYWIEGAAYRLKHG